MSVTVAITTAGLAKIREALNAGTEVVVDKFEIGATNGYTPTVGQSALQGAVIYSDASVGAGTNAALTVIKVRNEKNYKYAFELNLHLNGAIGDFNIGEFCFKLSDGTPLVFGVLSSVFAKKASDNDAPGNSLNIKSTIGYPAHEGSYVVS